MAEPKNRTKATGAPSFRRVTKSFNTAGGARRDEAKFTTARTGLVRSNSEGKDLTLAWIKEQGGNPADFHFTFGGNEETGQLALYLAGDGDQGVMKVAVYPNSIGFHVGAVFEEFPKLRPVTKVDCSVFPSVDAESVPCLILRIAGAAPSRTVKRKQAAGDEEPHT